MDKVPQLLERKKIGGRDIPIETFIRKKSERLLSRVMNASNTCQVAFYQAKDKRCGGYGTSFVGSIKINAAEGR